MNRKKNVVLALVLVAVALVAALLQSGKLDSVLGGKPTVWSERADEAQGVLADSFWDEKRKLFNNAAPCIAELCTDPFNYWWYAHGIDTLTDAYVGTQDDRYAKMIYQQYEGVLENNADTFINGYYDDMEWMALAWLRAYDATKVEKYLEASKVLWADIQTGWTDEMGGGIAWRKEQMNYKNTPANAPAVILAARMYAHTKDAADLEWAKKIYEWQKKTLVDPVTGLVWDGINRTGNGEIDKGWKFTYGQGVYIGAGVELYRATGEASYLEDARRTAANLKADFLSPATGMLPSEGEGDGGLFKGVLVRYVGELVKELKAGGKKLPELKAADGKALSAAEQAEELVQMLRVNAESLWGYGKAEDKALFSNSWAQTPDQVVQLSTQLSGMMLLEQMAAMEQAGWVKEKKE
ncbi:glycoside hydrolase family 76 protein [Paenibacillus gansuensis]|uniref:Glycoside hydrolase family 76 protein n=1 Tax=Paenibacillus gansuensis TaxID=306542 RepID=A0ABW5PHT7_9BACL